MRSALLCVFLTLIVQREGSHGADDGFRPIPIPLSHYYESRQSRAGTLQEIQTSVAPAVAAIPAHYWEDALRHSVYLTLVRDKIDQLIAKGDVVSPNSSEYVSKEVDDHYLWDKIKTAPFDRIQENEPSTFEDVTVMANGRLMEEKGGYRFAEDERTKEKCNDERCMDGVKAVWSVKRVRQREAETIPGKYHYELTFSVGTTPKKKRKPFENPTRTFTVKETEPERVEEAPQEHFRQPEQPVLPVLAARPQRAVWVHKNILPTQRHQGRQYRHGLESIFSSWFSDDDDEPPQRVRYVQAQPPTGQAQYVKSGYVGASSEQYQQKKIIPYPYKPHIKYVRPPVPPQPQPPVQQHYLDIVDTVGVVSNPLYVGQNNEHRYVVQGKPYKQPRPPVYPTSPEPVLPPTTTEAASVEDFSEINSNVTEETTRTPEIVTVTHNIHHIPKYRPKQPVRVNYFSEHVRPPVFNAPPGVFVTMDKKPFKPMPPIRYVHSSKPSKHRPIDFRPSPQLVDGKFSEPDVMFDSVFRPITVNYNDTRTTTETIEQEAVTPEYKPKKSTRPNKKPPKKNEIIKGHRITTSAPEIITAHNYASDDDSLPWADVLGAFSKTTPMASNKVKSIDSTTTTTSTTTSTTTPAPTTTKIKRTTTTTTEAPTTSTAKPTKRTRPPHKFKKPEKLVKHKRITTSTTTTTSTTQAPEKVEKKFTNDLTPQASSAATSTVKPWWRNLNKTLSTTTSTSTTTTSPTTTITILSTNQPENATNDSPSAFTSSQPKIKNRFRQSTLMQKGTSVNHDKWSAQAIPVEKSKTVPQANGSHLPRRKGSNFQGYVSPTAPRRDKERNKDDHTDRPIRPEGTTAKLESTSHPTQPTYEETADQYDNVGDSVSQSYNQIDNKHQEESPESNTEQDMDDDDTNTVEESRDHSEYIFSNTNSLSENQNEIVETEEPTFTEKTVITTPYAPPKNKTKCKKKKKVENLTTTEESAYDSDESEDEITTTTTSTTTTEKVTTPDIFEELLGGFTFNEPTQTEKTPSYHLVQKPDLDEQPSQDTQQFVKIDDDLEEFLDSLEGKGKYQYKNVDDDQELEYEEDDDEDDENDPSIDDEESAFDNENDAEYKRESRDARYIDYEEPSGPLSLFELMAME